MDGHILNLDDFRVGPFFEDAVGKFRGAKLRRTVCDHFIELCERMTPQLEAELASMSYRDFLDTDYWLYLRDYVVMARGMRCEACHHVVGLLQDSLELHHISYDHRGSEWRHMEDLKVLCRVCHAQERR
jgi:hypothetical protein